MGNFVVSGSDENEAWPDNLRQQHDRDDDEEAQDEGASSQQQSEGDQVDAGYWLSLDRDFHVIPIQRTCFYCCEEGKLHPVERITCYPCCGYNVCLDCVRKSFCGECLTKLPFYENQNAMIWIKNRMESESLVPLGKSRALHLLGRIFVNGSHTFLDELMRQPLYDRIPPPCQTLAILNPPNVQLGVNYLTAAAEGGVIAAMLDLGNTYNSNYHNDTFKKDKKKAEYWFRRALGEGNTIFPLAFTQYGEFLKWESRLAEGRQMFEVAARFGHARGQYEYALCLLEGLGRDTREQDGGQVCTKDEVTQAIEWLCKASNRGFYIPSYIRLSKVLTDIAENEYGTAADVGTSPLPRVLQILSLAKDGGYGDSKSVQQETAELLERYDCKRVCCNCGSEGSENHPLLACTGCGVVAYCSKICQKKGFRDGHKFDCCSQGMLFDFHSIKLTLPWIKNAGWKGRSTLPSLKRSQGRTLMQMVEDDTDEIYGEEEIDYDEHISAGLMLRMRVNLETYLDRSLTGEDKKQDGGSAEGGCNSARKYKGDVRNMNLKKRIDVFAERFSANKDFIRAMHKIREYGNSAAHGSLKTLDEKECRESVRAYRQYKEDYEIKSSRIQAAASSKNCLLDGQSKNSNVQVKSKEPPPSNCLRVGEAKQQDNANESKARIQSLSQHDTDAISKTALPPEGKSGAGSTSSKRTKRKKKNQKKK